MYVSLEYIGVIAVLQVSGSAEVWEVYADYHFSSTDTADHEKVERDTHTHTHCQTSIIVVPDTIYKSYFPPPTFCVVSQGLLELQKAQRCARQASGWDREWAGLERAVQLTLAYCHSQSNSIQLYSTSASSELVSRGAFLRILCYRE